MCLRGEGRGKRKEEAKHLLTKRVGSKNIGDIIRRTDISEREQRISIVITVRLHQVHAGVLTSLPFHALPNRRCREFTQLYVETGQKGTEQASEEIGITARGGRVDSAHTASHFFAWWRLEAAFFLWSAVEWRGLLVLVAWLFPVLLLAVLRRDAACLLRLRCEVTDFPLRLVDRFFARSLWTGLKEGITT